MPNRFAGLDRRFASLLAALALAIGATVASAQISFTDVTAQSGMTHSSETFGASWGDLNGDGYPDLYVSNHRTPDSLWLNRGHGIFFDVGKQVLTWINHKNGDTHGGTWADFDNDGDQDLLVSTGTGNLIMFFVNKNADLVDETAQLGVAQPSQGGRMPVWLDFNRDGLLDIVLTQYGKTSKVFRQNSDGSGFKDVTAGSQMTCFGYHYAHLYDVTGDGNLDFLCPDQTLFPQKIYDTRPFPWHTLFDSTTPNSVFPLVNQVVDSVTADFNNDGRVDMFLLSGLQLRASSVVANGSSGIEAQLANGTKGFTFNTSGVITVNMDWNKADEGTNVDLAKVKIGAGGKHPKALPFILDPSDPTVAGMPPPPVGDADLPAMQIGYNKSTQQWTLFIATTAPAATQKIFSEAYLRLSSTAPVTNLKSTGLWPSDHANPPTLLMNYPGAFVNTTVSAGLGAAVQCSSVTAGDFDNDMYVDLFLHCGTGASNTADILYRNQGDGTFVAVPNAGGAAGPVGAAVGSGAGTADSVVTADYDVDGFLDLFATNGMNLRPLYYGGPNKLFHNNGNGNHWIEIDLVATKSERDATGARIYATAGGVTQLRVQDGAYHRWSQNFKRSHFGLASNKTVDLRVEWPSGTVETYPGVAANKLYRITEKSGIAPVALGAGPAYQCGSSSPIGAVDSGVYIWKDCPSGQWRLKTAVAGGDAVYTGTITSSGNYSGVVGQGLHTGDSIINSNPKQIQFTFHTTGAFTDGVNFTAADGSTNCLKLTSSAGVTPVYFGPFRVPENQSISLETQASCP